MADEAIRTLLDKARVGQPIPDLTFENVLPNFIEAEFGDKLAAIEDGAERDSFRESLSLYYTTGAGRATIEAIMHDMEYYYGVANTVISSIDFSQSDPTPTGGGGLIKRVYTVNDFVDPVTVSSEPSETAENPFNINAKDDTFNAYAINSLHQRIKVLESAPPFDPGVTSVMELTGDITKQQLIDGLELGNLAFEDSVAIPAAGSTSMPIFIDVTNGPTAVTDILGIRNFSASGTASVGGTFSATGKSSLLGGIVLGDSVNARAAEMVWDEQNNAWHLKGNIYADGFVTAGGVGSGGGGEGVGLQEVWQSLMNTAYPLYANNKIAPAHLFSTDPAAATGLILGDGLTYNANTRVLSVSTLGTVTSVAGVTPVNGDIQIVPLQTALGLGAAAYKGVGSVAQNNQGLVTGGDVWAAIDALPEPMIFKGSLGTGGTITSLPTASAANEGYTYKVITDGTYAGQTAKIGDLFISNGSTWIWIPSGDEPSGTVTSVGMSVPTGLSVSGSPITTSGTFAITFANGYSIPLTADTNKGVTAYGWGDHAQAGYLLASTASFTYATITALNGVSGRVSTLEARQNWDDIFAIDSNGNVYLKQYTEGGETKSRGFWTYSFVSAGGVGSGGGGGGGVGLVDVWNSMDNSQYSETYGNRKIHTNHLPTIVSGTGLVYTNTTTDNVLSTTVGLASGYIIPTVSSGSLISVSHLYNFWQSLQNSDIVTTYDNYKIHINHIPDLSGTYLPLSGGTIDSTTFGALCIKRGSSTGYSPGIKFQDGSNVAGYIGVQYNSNGYLPCYWDASTNAYPLWHSGNFTPGDYVTLNTDQTINSTKTFVGNVHIRNSATRISILPWSDGTYIESMTEDGTANVPLWITGTSGREGSSLYLYFANIYATSSQYPVLHSGNYSNYALPLSGGEMTGTLKLAQETGSWNVSGADKAIRSLYNSDTATTGSPGMYFSGMSFMTGYNGFQIAVYAGEATDAFQIRKTSDWITGGWTNWFYLWHSGNSGSTSYNWSAQNLTLAGAVTGATSIDSLLYFDTTNSRVGIGESSPYYTLDVNGTVAAGSGVKAVGLYVYGSRSNIINDWYYTRIATVYERQSQYTLDGAMVFYTMNSTHEAGTEVERMRLSSLGRLGIGTNDPQYLLDVNGTLRASGAAYFSSAIGVVGKATFSGTNGISLGGYTDSNNTTESVITWDANAHAWKVEGNLYATGFISAGGAGSGSGGGGSVDLTDVWASLQNDGYGSYQYNKFHQDHLPACGTGLTYTVDSDGLATGIGIASGYKLPTTTEWGSKADASALAGYLPLTAGSSYQLTGNLFSTVSVYVNGVYCTYGGDLELRTTGSSSDDSGDIAFYYGNGQEKARLWMSNSPGANGPNFRVYDSSGTSLYNGRLATLADIPSLSNVVTLTGAQTITGQKNFNTSTNTVPFIISRVGYDSESLKIGVDDDTAVFNHIQDETASHYIFYGTYTDTEGGGGAAAGQKYVAFWLSSSTAAISVNGDTVLHAGNYSSYALSKSGGMMNAGAQIMAATNDNEPNETDYNGGIQVREYNYSGATAGVDKYNAPGITFHWATRYASKLWISGSDGSLNWGSNVVWTAGNDGSGSGLDADLWQGYAFNTSETSNYNNITWKTLLFSATNAVTNRPLEDYTYGIRLKQAGEPHYYYTDIVTGLFTDALYYRRHTPSGYQSWKQIAFTDSQLVADRPTSRSAGQIGRWFTAHSDSYSGAPATGWFNGFTFAADENTGYKATLALHGTSNRMWYHASTNDGWREVAFLDSNVASATKLNTARGIWGQSFDGTSDISGALLDVSVIEFTGAPAGHGGIIDFHYSGSSADYTSRIMETASATLDINDKLYVVNGGNVGINKSNPVGVLDIVPGSNQNGVVLRQNTSGYSVIRFHSDTLSDNDGAIHYFDSFGNYTNTLNLQASNGITIGAWSVAARHMLWDNVNYRLGVGTDSPTCKVDVSGAIRAYADWSGYNPLAKFEKTNAQYAILEICNTVDSFQLICEPNGAGWVYVNGQYPLCFHTNATERMRISAAGNVGIGMTPDSAYKLDVNGSMRLNGSINFTNSGAFQITDYGNIYATTNTNSDYWCIRPYGGSTNTFAVNAANGYVGIGAKNNSNYLLYVNGTAQFTDDAIFPISRASLENSPVISGSALAATETTYAEFKDALSATRSYIGSCQGVDGWKNVISIRHRNGSDDGNYYGMAIWSQMTAGGHQNLYWSRQSTAWDSANWIIWDSANANLSTVNWAANNLTAAGTLSVTGAATFSSTISAVGGISSQSYVTAGAAASSSDIALKNNVQDVNGAYSLSLLMQMRPKEWIWNEKHFQNGKKSAGLIAQDMESILPFSVMQQGEYKYLEYNVLHAYEIAAIQTHESRIEQLERENQMLREKVQQLEMRN